MRAFLQIHPIPFIDLRLPRDAASCLSPGGDDDGDGDAGLWCSSW